jgi:dTDP-4-amino-4,6-dideoxygalactose transaminase
MGLATNGKKKVVPETLKTRWPVVTQDDKDAVLRALENGVLHGAYTPETIGLEEDFARFIGARYCIATNSGTAALHMAVASGEIGPGDEVITSAFSFLASATAILHHNAIPVFVDIDPVTYNIDVGKIEEKITPQTKAIMPVHIHGLPVDMDGVNELAQRHHLLVIEDACQSHGAAYKGKKTGTLGDMAAFSLNVTKNLSGGEGGLFVTDDRDLRNEANKIRMFGEDIKPGEVREYNAYGMGWMYRTFDVPAAFARSQLRRLNIYNAKAQRNGEYLTEHLNEIKGIIPPLVPEDRMSVYHKYRVRLDMEELDCDLESPVIRDRIMEALQAEGVDVALWQTLSIPGQRVFQVREGYGKGCPWSCPFYGREVSYDVDDYPETNRLLDESFVICSEQYPIYGQSLELMKYYVEGFHSVFDNLDEILD